MYCRAEGRWDGYTRENGKREMEETRVTMKDLWQALWAGGGFISLLSTKSLPLRCSTYLVCSALSLFCIPTHSLSRSMLTPDAITIYNPASPTLPFTLYCFFLFFTIYSPLTFFLLVPPRLFDFVSLVQSTLLPPRFSLAHSFLCALFLSVPPPVPPSCLPPFPNCWSIFCLLCLRCLFSPLRLPVYLPALCNPWGLLINASSPYLPSHSPFSSHLLPPLLLPRFSPSLPPLRKAWHLRVNRLMFWQFQIRLWHFNPASVFIAADLRSAGLHEGLMEGWNEGWRRRKAEEEEEVGACGMVQLHRDCGPCMGHRRGRVDLQL